MLFHLRAISAHNSPSHLWGVWNRQHPAVINKPFWTIIFKFRKVVHDRPLQLHELCKAIHFHILPSTTILALHSSLWGYVYHNMGSVWRWNFSAIFYLIGWKWLSKRRSNSTSGTKSGPFSPAPWSQLRDFSPAGVVIKLCAWGTIRSSLPRWRGWHRLSAATTMQIRGLWLKGDIGSAKFACGHQ